MIVHSQSLALDQDFVLPITAYLSQYVELVNRAKERGRRRTDMDRFKAEVRDLTLKPPDKPEKLQKVSSPSLLNFLINCLRIASKLVGTISVRRPRETMQWQRLDSKSLMQNCLGICQLCMLIVLLSSIRALPP